MRNKERFLVKKLVLVFASTVLLAPVLADDISVNEFVPGTIISSADMNENFDTLVEESNENDDRITVLENATSSSSAAVGAMRVWVDATGAVLGYVNGIYERGAFALIPESNLVFGSAYTINNINPDQYNAPDVLYSLPGCKGDLAIQVGTSNGQVYSSGHEAVSYGVDIDGYYVYPAEPLERFEGKFYAQSRTNINDSTGEITCQGMGSAVDAYPGTRSQKQYVVPITRPVFPRWQ